MPAAARPFVGSSRIGYRGGSEQPGGKSEPLPRPERIAPDAPTWPERVGWKSPDSGIAPTWRVGCSSSRRAGRRRSADLADGRASSKAVATVSTAVIAEHHGPSRYFMRTACSLPKLP